MVYVCMYVCMYVWCIYVCMYVCIIIEGRSIGVLVRLEVVDLCTYVCIGMYALYVCTVCMYDVCIYMYDVIVYLWHVHFWVWMSMYCMYRLVPSLASPFWMRGWNMLACCHSLCDTWTKSHTLPNPRLLMTNHHWWFDHVYIRVYTKAGRQAERDIDNTYMTCPPVALWSSKTCASWSSVPLDRDAHGPGQWQWLWNPNFVPACWCCSRVSSNRQILNYVDVRGPSLLHSLHRCCW